jgi:phage shock protein E
MELRTTVIVAIAVLFVGVAVVGSWKSSTPTGGVPLGVQELDADGFARAIADDGVFVLDVHDPSVGFIPGTDAFLPFDAIATYQSELPVDRAAPIAVYCRSGNMSRQAVVSLQELGYTNLIHLTEGMRSWEASGRQLEHAQ